MGWVFSILVGRNPAYDSEQPPTRNQWREQWLVLDNQVVNSTVDTVEPVVVASYSDRWEAEEEVNALNKRFDRINQFTLVQVPYPVYSNAMYAGILSKLGEEE